MVTGVASLLLSVPVFGYLLIAGLGSGPRLHRERSQDKVPVAVWARVLLAVYSGLVLAAAALILSVILVPLFVWEWGAWLAWKVRTGCTGKTRRRSNYFPV